MVISKYGYSGDDLQRVIAGDNAARLDTIEGVIRVLAADQVTKLETVAIKLDALVAALDVANTKLDSTSTKLDALDVLIRAGTAKSDSKLDALDVLIRKVAADQGTRLDAIIKTENEIMADLDQDIALVQAQSTQIDGVTTLVTSLKQQIADALSGVTLPPVVQAKVDAVFDGLTANSGKLATALSTDASGQPVA